MKFLVVGCNGMAGHLISLYLSEQGHEVLGFAREKSKLVNSIAGDVRDAGLIEKIILDGGFDFVVNCVGKLNQFAEEYKAQAVYVNAYFPHFLAEITKNLSTRIIHMSTDCVFSGKRGDYVENDFCDGETFYDRSKALGELIDDKNITLRNSIVGPDINVKGIGLFNWFMNQTGTIKGYTKAIWTGQTTLQLAKTIEKIATTKAFGLFNMVPNFSISKYDLLRLFNRYLRNDAVIINPIDGLAADKSLRRTRFDVDIIIPDYETMVSEMAQWINTHKSIYPHYGL